jgi:hypothetical protein
VFFLYLTLAFNIWMLVDAGRRRAEFYWYIVILFVPFGALIYFAMIKLPELRGRTPALSALPAAAAPPGRSLIELERLAEETPSVLNKLALADGLLAEARYPEAIERYRELLDRDGENREALHGLARALLATQKPAEAAEELDRLMSIDKTFRDYSAALDYAEALWQCDRRDDAIGLLEGLVGVNSRINHRLALAHYLAESGNTVGARNELERALRDYATSPDYVRRRDGRWFERARQMLAGLGPSTP